jgi:uncharacterized protein (DUF305 family)
VRIQGNVSRGLRRRPSTSGPRTHLSAVLCVLLVCATLASCDDRSVSQATKTSSVSPQVADHNHRDVIFAHAMLTNNNQAISLAMMAPTNSTDVRLTAIASQMVTGLQTENQALTAWLAQWGDDPHVDSSMPHDRPGMADLATVNQLQSLRGPQFDQLWLDTMVVHHQGAIEIAQLETAHGSNNDAVAMAKSMIGSRQAEIDKIKQIQRVCCMDR